MLRGNIIKILDSENKLFFCDERLDNVGDLGKVYKIIIKRRNFVKRFVYKRIDEFVKEISF